MDRSKKIKACRYVVRPLSHDPDVQRPRPNVRTPRKIVTVRFVVVVDEICCRRCPAADMSSPDEHRRYNAEHGCRYGSRRHSGNQQRPASTVDRLITRVDAYAHRVKITAIIRHLLAHMIWTVATRRPRVRATIVLFLHTNQLIAVTS